MSLATITAGAARMVEVSLLAAVCQTDKLFTGQPNIAGPCFDGCMDECCRDGWVYCPECGEDQSRNDPHQSWCSVGTDSDAALEGCVVDAHNHVEIVEVDEEENDMRTEIEYIRGRVETLLLDALVGPREDRKEASLAAAQLCEDYDLDLDAHRAVAYRNSEGYVGPTLSQDDADRDAFARSCAHLSNEAFFEAMNNYDAS